MDLHCSIGRDELSTRVWYLIIGSHFLFLDIEHTVDGTPRSLLRPFCITRGHWFCFSSIKTVVCAMQIASLYILARHTKRFIGDTQIIHGFAFSAPGLPMVLHAHPKSVLHGI